MNIQLARKRQRFTKGPSMGWLAILASNFQPLVPGGGSRRDTMKRRGRASGLGVIGELFGNSWAGRAMAGLMHDSATKKK